MPQPAQPDLKLLNVKTTNDLIANHDIDILTMIL